MQLLKIFIGALSFVVVATGQTFAQSPMQNKEKVSRKTLPVKTGKESIILFFPDFFQYGLVKKGDTAFSYEYYNRDLLKINIYDVKNIDEIEHVRYFEMFSRYPANKKSNISSSVEYMLLCEFVHPEPDIWLQYDRIKGEITRYKIYRNTVVGTDSTTITDAIANNQRNFIYKYCKTELISKQSGQSHMH